jgi:multisubunit Na+/H+ antiporter MnhF subunit
MHIAMVIGLLGLIGTFPGLIKFFPLLTGAEIARPAAVITQTIMAILCIYYLVSGIKSFIDARKKGV